MVGAWRRIAGWWWVVALVCASACSEDKPGPEPEPDLGTQDMADDAQDMAEDTQAPDLDTPDAVEDLPDTQEPLGLCEPCTEDSMCGGELDRCLQLPNEPSPTCVTDCSTDPEACPEGFSCLTVQELPRIDLCIPDSFACEDRCAGVNCPQGQGCDPVDGQCTALLGLCDLDCTADSLCGGPEDRCVNIPEVNESYCAQACSLELPCPESYFCAEVGTGTGNFQCVPQDLTCVDRCAEVNCPNGQVCDPQTGACTQPLQLCDTGCVSSALCGTSPDDICIGLGNPDGESICVTGCQDNSQCPLNYFCAQLNNRDLGACVPLDLTCVTDRCDGVDCGPDANCDVRTGQCVRREVALCEPCGQLPSAACGGPEDLCLNLGDTVGSVCTQDCSDDGQCPNEGYQCLILNNTTRRACVPIGNDCARCANVDCPEGASCNPLTGQCISPQLSCLEQPCEEGQVCNTDNGQCELIGEPCTYEDRRECFGPVRRCTATRPDTEGVCALICDSDADCTPSAPRCQEMSRVGDICVPEGLGGPVTCGILSPEGVDIGRRCGDGVTTACPQAAPTCVQDIEADVPGFCSRACDSDLDCGGQGTCQALRGQPGRFCTPVNCLCLAGNAVPEGQRDILGEALAVYQSSRCGFSLDPASQRVLDPATPQAPLRLPLVASLLAQPLSGAGVGDSLRQDLQAALGAGSPARDALIAAAARQGILLEARQPTWDIPDELSPLEEGLRRFSQAAGDSPQQETQGDPAAVPAPMQSALARILFAAANLLEVRQGMLDASGISPEQAQALFQALPWMTLRPPTGGQKPDLEDPALLALLEELDLSPLYQAAADLLATLEQQRAALLEGDADFSVRLHTQAGWIILGGAGDSTWDPALDDTLGQPIALLLDLSGNDTYRIPVGATSSAAQPLGLLLDLSGDDTYTYTSITDPRDQSAWLPSDQGGRFAPERPVQASDGPVSLSATPRQGAGILGAGLLWDASGDDTYQSLRVSQGAGVLGVGALIDAGGADSYQMEALGQGAGVLGLGLLLDLGGQEGSLDQYRVWHAGQGFGAARGVGALIDAGGPSRYTAEPASGLEDVLYYAPADRGLSNNNLAQGVGAGLYPPEDRFPDRRALGGGLGLLLDLGGDDVYTAGTQAQGAGVHLGAGFLIDQEGQDQYRARFGAQGFGDTAGFGALLEGGGDDSYNLNGARLLGSLLGHGNNLAAGLALERGGDDTYRLPRASGGAGQRNGAGALLDLGGDDEHQASNNSTWGYAVLGPEGDQDGDPRRQLPTLGLFVDGAGADSYLRPDLEGDNPPGIGQDQTWTQRANEALDSEQGVGVDGDGNTGLE